MRCITIAITVFAVTLSACNDSNPVGPTAAVAGQYSLRAINGTPLPVTFSSGATLVSEVLTLNNDGTFSDDAQFSDGSVAVEQGFFVNNNGALDFTDRDTGETFSASLSGSILTEFVRGLTEVYQRM
jgi:hypothetical protein